MIQLYELLKAALDKCGKSRRQMRRWRNRKTFPISLLNNKPYQYLSFEKKSAGEAGQTLETSIWLRRYPCSLAGAPGTRDLADILFKYHFHCIWMRKNCVILAGRSQDPCNWARRCWYSWKTAFIVSPSNTPRSPRNFLEYHQI
jgi:hypothetical protein